MRIKIFPADVHGQKRGFSFFGTSFISYELENLARMLFEVPGKIKTNDHADKS